MNSNSFGHLGNKIKVNRKKQKLTQEKLSEITGIEIKYLQKIESKNPPNITLKTLAKIAKALKTTPAKLIESK